MLARASSERKGSARLAARRRTRRRRIVLAFGVLLFAVCGALIYGLRQEAVRISHIEVFGTDVPVESAAASALEGYYLGLIPRDSIFFFPEERIRASVLKADTGVLAVSIFRKGFDGLSIKVAERVPVGRWCGVSLGAGDCYLYDASGYIYAEATTTAAVNPFALYAPLAGEASEPLRATIADADDLPSTFDFARQLAAFGSPVTKIVIHDGEVDDHLESGTRVTYVLGDEQNAFTALTSAHGNVSLADGSVEYVDLRFDGKVYLKRKE